MARAHPLAFEMSRLPALSATLLVLAMLAACGSSASLRCEGSPLDESDIADALSELRGQLEVARAQRGELGRMVADRQVYEDRRPALKSLLQDLQQPVWVKFPPTGCEAGQSRQMPLRDMMHKLAQLEARQKLAARQQDARRTTAQSAGGRATATQVEATLIDTVPAAFYGGGTRYHALVCQGELDRSLLKPRVKPGDVDTEDVPEKVDWAEAVKRSRAKWVDIQSIATRESYERQAVQLAQNGLALWQLHERRIAELRAQVERQRSELAAHEEQMREANERIEGLQACGRPAGGGHIVVSSLATAGAATMRTPLVDAVALAAGVTQAAALPLDSYRLFGQPLTTAQVQAWNAERGKLAKWAASHRDQLAGLRTSDLWHPIRRQQMLARLQTLSWFRAPEAALAWHDLVALQARVAVLHALTKRNDGQRLLEATATSLGEQPPEIDRLALLRARFAVEALARHLPASQQACEAGATALAPLSRSTWLEVFTGGEIKADAGP